MAKKLLYVLATLPFLATLACGTTPEENRVEAMTKQETPAKAPGELATRGAELFANTPNLTESQREQLLKIHGDTYQQVSKIRDEITQAKTVLFRDLVNPNTSKKEISALKNKIIKLDKQRLDIMLKAFDDVQKAVGKAGADEEVIRPFMEIEHGRI